MGSVVFWIGITLFVIGALALVSGVILFGGSLAGALSGADESEWEQMQITGMWLSPLGFVMLIAGIAMIVIGRRH